MHKKTRYGDFTFGWDKTLGNMEVNAGELSHLEHARLALQALRDRVTRLQVEQRYHEAERQRATREMQEALAEGEKTATFLRTGIKLVYGNDNEKLLEFGIQPLRRRSGEKRKKAAAPKVVQEVTPEPEPPAPEEDVLLETRPAEPLAKGPSSSGVDESLGCAPILSPRHPAGSLGDPKDLGGGTSLPNPDVPPPGPSYLDSSVKSPTDLGGGGLDVRFSSSGRTRASWVAGKLSSTPK